jgi:hypothetical protein
LGARADGIIFGCRLHANALSLAAKVAILVECITDDPETISKSSQFQRPWPFANLCQSPPLRKFESFEPGIGSRAGFLDPNVFDANDPCH